jgi:hypothetical protein
MRLLIGGLFSLGAREEGYFEYPFGKNWVIASAVMSAIAIAFAIAVLGSDAFGISLYFLFTCSLTLVVLVLKFQYYSTRKEEIPEEYSSGGEEQASEDHWKRSFVILLIVIAIALISPLIFSYILDPMWWIIIISGFVPGVSIPEVILYLYSRRSAK